MIVLFRAKIKEEFRNFKWFRIKYLPPGYSYVSFIQQINGFKKMSDEVKNAILKYINEG